MAENSLNSSKIPSGTESLAEEQKVLGLKVTSFPVYIRLRPATSTASLRTENICMGVKFG